MAKWTHLRRLSRSRPMAPIPSAGIMSAPRPNSTTSGATLVSRPGTSEPRAPITEAAAETGDWRAWVAVVLAGPGAESEAHSSVLACASTQQTPQAARITILLASALAPIWPGTCILAWRLTSLMLAAGCDCDRVRQKFAQRQHSASFLLGADLVNLAAGLLISARRCRRPGAGHEGLATRRRALTAPLEVKSRVHFGANGPRPRPINGRPAGCERRPGHAPAATCFSWPRRRRRSARIYSLAGRRARQARPARRARPACRARHWPGRRPAVCRLLTQIRRTPDW